MRRKKLESVGLEPPEWVNEAGYRYRSRRAFDAAQEQICEEKRVLQPVYTGERLATPEEMKKVRRHYPEDYGPGGLGPAIVAAAVLIGWCVAAFVVFWFLTAALGLA